jgi:hypothetical protein
MLTLTKAKNGTKLIVTSRYKDKNLTPGSILRLRRIIGVDKEFPALLKCRGLFMRKGKTGLPRLDTVDFYTPVMRLDTEKFAQIIPIGRGYVVDVRHTPDDLNKDPFDMYSWTYLKGETFANDRQLPNNLPKLSPDHPVRMYQHMRERLAFERKEALDAVPALRKNWFALIRELEARMFRQEVQEILQNLGHETSAMRTIEHVNVEQFTVVAKAKFVSLRNELRAAVEAWKVVANQLQVPLGPHLKMFW